MTIIKPHRFSKIAIAVISTVMVVRFAAAAESVDGTDGLHNRSIGYVMTYENRAIYLAPKREDQCVALNEGPTEQFKRLYPESGERTVEGTRLAWEGELWNPSEKGLPLPYYEPMGKAGLGLNLDGKIDESDFTSPDGRKGIDNQLYRVLGCTFNYRDGHTSINTKAFVRDPYNIFVIELTDVDSLADDDEVVVTTYRGADPLMLDATGQEYLPGASQTVDTRWGARYIQQFKGRIVGGVLTTEAKDLTMPMASPVAPRDGASDIIFRDMRFELNLTQANAEGYMGGYADIFSWYYNSHKTRDTAHQDYGGTSGTTMWRSLVKNADAYPDPQTGQNTAISSALDVKFVQVFVRRPDKQVAAAIEDTRLQSPQVPAR